MNKYFQNIPLGKSLPLDNPHAVSVNFPTLKDVIGYEENLIEVKSQMQSGYPRFFMNRLVEKLCFYIRCQHKISENFEIFPLMSIDSLSALKTRFDLQFNIINENDCCFLIIEKKSKEFPQIKDFIRHTGLLVSSRKAEDVLFSLGLINKKFDEDLNESNDAELAIKKGLCEAYGVNSNENILLCNSGMNAIYSVFDAVSQHNLNTKKYTILQAGWLYLDTLEIIKKYSKKSILVNSVTDFIDLEEKIISEKFNIGAVFTEVPNNPLLECLDLQRLYDLCKKHEIILIVDSTIGTPFILNVLPFCDIVVESLTKFASGNGDLLMGAIIFNPDSVVAEKLKEKVSQTVVKPYIKDIKRLAKSIEDYENRIEIISKNTLKLIEYLENSKAVSKVFSVLQNNSNENFLKICKNKNFIPGLISVVFNKELSFYYDKLNIPKGPSFGTEFTLAMPYVYLAHYDMVKTEEGKNILLQMGVNPELLRISVGTEPIEEIINAFKEAGI